MSGGHFDYKQWYFSDIADSIEEYMFGKELDECDIEEYINYHDLSKEESEYIKKHHHTIPNCYKFNEETISEFKTAISLLRKAAIYITRIDYLFSGDDGEETFHKRLKEDLKNQKE